MRLNEQIEIERKNKGLSKKKLVQIIEEWTDVNKVDTKIDTI